MKKQMIGKNSNIKDNPTKITYFERALFFSWYCGLGDCKFCYMSINKKSKNSKKDPKKARRSFASIIAETLICKELGWKIEFLSGGYESYSKKELLFLIKAIYTIMKEKQWLNIGTLKKDEIKEFLPYIEGYAGTIETVNWELRRELCPSKKLEPILETFSHCDELKLKKAMTIIIGLGETIKDFNNLKEFIEKKGISRITFYALNPHPGTPFKTSPKKDYYCKWISNTRKVFPKIEIIAGAWTDKPNYYSAVLEAGADSITKLPVIRKFGSKELRLIENEIKKADRKLNGSFTKIPVVNWEKKIKMLDKELFNKELKEETKKKLNLYLKQMKKNLL